MDTFRAPAVAGAFYPASPEALQSQLATLMESAPATAAKRPPKALIAPHAGYIYSGPTAAHAYNLLAPFGHTYRRVLLLGPAHRVRVRGLALPSVAAFATPLGRIPLDRPAMDAIRHLPQVCASDEAHAQEHSLEVHLPFLQRVLGEFSLVPLAVGEATATEVAEVLAVLWGGDETLVLVSSDLSHYLSYAQACEADGRTTQAILSLQPGIRHQQACGATPVNGLLQEARARGLVPQLLDLRNSGDTAGDRNRVVGYASIGFFPSDGAESAIADGRMLLSVARASIAGSFGLHYDVKADAPFLDSPGASFVTLKKEGRLRGCIGSLQPHRNLREDVHANALAAAFRDPRFEPLKFDELRDIRIEVSVLSPLRPMSFADEADARAQLRPGIDGIVLEHEGHRGTFLPQVWEALPEPAQFLRELKRKAGLPAEFWDARVRLSRYDVSKWEEQHS